MTVLHDLHNSDCTCSYCGQENKTGRMHYGLNIPESKALNSWWVIKYWRRRYFRWTNSWLKQFKR